LCVCSTRSLPEWQKPQAAVGAGRTLRPASTATHHVTHVGTRQPRAWRQRERPLPPVSYNCGGGAGATIGAAKHAGQARTGQPGQPPCCPHPTRRDWSTPAHLVSHTKPKHTIAPSTLRDALPPLQYGSNAFHSQAKTRGGGAPPPLLLLHCKSRVGPPAAGPPVSGPPSAASAAPPTGFETILYTVNVPGNGAQHKRVRFLLHNERVLHVAGPSGHNGV
jgi:hypothetical protein